jgi:hypothetical protein
MRPTLEIACAADSRCATALPRSPVRLMAMMPCPVQTAAKPPLPRVFALRSAEARYQSGDQSQKKTRGPTNIVSIQSRGTAYVGDGFPNWAPPLQNPLGPWNRAVSPESAPSCSTLARCETGRGRRDSEARIRLGSPCWGISKIAPWVTAGWAEDRVGWLPRPCGEPRAAEPQWSVALNCFFLWALQNTPPYKPSSVAGCGRLLRRQLESAAPLQRQ